MYAKVFSATTIGVDAHSVQVEVDVSLGLVNFYIVGLPDTAIKESSKRISTALKNSGIRLPAKKITVNLAPADLKKVGTLFDLPITLGILLASGYLELDKKFLQETLFIGELSLDGTISRIKGALAVAYDAHKLGKKRIVLPAKNSIEASLIEDIEVIGVHSIVELIAYLRKEKKIEPATHGLENFVEKKNISKELDFSQVKGQQYAKRALQIAAAGRHNILFVGPPGSGKTMLAKRLSSIMPPLSFNEMLETSKVYSISGKLRNKGLVFERPFRTPHHTISQAGLVGGGSYPQPGEISLAHNGILFLDELTEFKRDTLEVLRQPLENKKVCIARAQHTINFPASFLLVAALNPCPCGFWGDSKKECSCSPQQINRYMDKLSGPLLDRIDLQITIKAVEYSMIKDKNKSNITSAQMYENVRNALNKQYKRFGAININNSNMSPDMIEKFCGVTPAAEVIVKKAFDVLHLSMRGYHKLLKISRTIADIEGVDIINVSHIQEALMYRSLDQTLEKR